MKKLFFTLMFTFLNSALAQNVEVVSLKQAEDILTYRAPTTAADVIGKWKKVLHGPPTAPSAPRTARPSASRSGPTARSRGCTGGRITTCPFRLDRSAHLDEQ